MLTVKPHQHKPFRNSHLSNGHNVKPPRNEKPNPETEEELIEDLDGDPGFDNSNPQGALANLVNNKFFQFLPSLGNALSVVGNSLSTLFHTVPVPKSLQVFGKLAGIIGTKSFLFTNGLANTLEQLDKNNYISALGYFLDLPIGYGTKQENVYLTRGLVVGSYTLGNAISLINKKDRFNNLSEYIHYFAKTMKQSFKNITDFKDFNFIKHILNSETGLLSIINSGLTYAGTALWGLTGSEKIGATFRDLGGFLQDLEQLKPGHFNTRKYFWWSGVAFTVGTVFDYWAKWQTAAKDKLIPLSLMFDGVGRHLLRISQNESELTRESNKIKAFY